MSQGTQENHTMDEVIGLVLLGTGTLLFLALLSYVPEDVSWVKVPPNRPAQNFIGPVGATVAYVFYFLLGAAAYFLSTVMLGLGGAKLFGLSMNFKRRLLWAALFVVSGACLLEIQHYVLIGWKKNIGPEGPGGWIGLWLGGRVFKASFGTLGSTILLGVIYLSTLTLLSGIKPITLLRALLSLPPKWWARYQKLQLERADERQRLDLEQKKLARDAKRLEKELVKKGVRVPLLEPVNLEQPPSEEDEVERPTPQIIDTAMSPPVRAKVDKGDLTTHESVSFENYTLPGLDLLDEIDVANRQAADPEELLNIQATLIDTLAHFNVSVAAGDITKGPTITRYELYPAKGVSVDRIVSREKDLALATRAESIHILAPVPGKDTVGIEIANSRKVKVTFRELIESEEWAATKMKIPLALGKDVYGKTIFGDLAQMPHCLVAGTTGSGKSVCINAIIASILYRFTPEELRFILIDPKVVEMQVYNKLPHLVAPVVTEPKKVLLALRWVIDEMEKRYKIFAKCGVRNVSSFNSRPKPKSQKELDEEQAANEDENAEVQDDTAPEPPPIRVPREDDLIIPDQMPYIVVIIDELADLMQTAPADVESAIQRITQMARAAGIHMIVATQTPRADVITGVIKANIPSRIAFQVANGLDSRIILDDKGAERLLGQGDMLYVPPGSSRMVRSQGVLVTDDEIRRLVDFVAAQSPAVFVNDMHDRLHSTRGEEEEVSDEDEELVEKCIEIMRQENRASTSLFQRRLRLGYTRAARVLDILEQRGYVGPGEGAKPREILKQLDDPLD